MAKKKRELKVIMVAGVTSAALLATTAFAAASTISGFEDIKKAIFNFTKIENYTVEANIDIKIDGEIAASNYVIQKTEDYLNSSTITESYALSEHSSIHHEFLQDGTRVGGSPDNGYYSYGYFDHGYDFAHMNNELTDNQVRLANLLMDLAAGDTKNYFYNNNGNITLSLEGNQIPEIVQLSTSVMTELMGESQRIYREETGMDLQSDIDIPIPVGNSLIDRVNLNVNLDEDGNFEDVDFSVVMLSDDMYGVSHSYEVAMVVNISDIGNTIADKVDTENLITIEEYFGDDYFDYNFDYEYDYEDYDYFNEDEIIGSSDDSAEMTIF